MPACEKCGANVAPQAIKCPYCNTDTPFGQFQAAEQERYRAAAQFEQARYAQASAAQAHWQAQAEVQKSADQAFVWAIVGVVVCCIPIFAILAIVFGFRARSLALAKNLPVPGKATAAIVLGFVSFFLLGGGWLFSRQIEAEKKEHQATLVKEIGKHAGDASLAPNIACKLGELYLIDTALHGSKITDGNVDCDAAKFDSDAEKATLTGVRVRFTDSGQVEEANVCLERGQKWFVHAVVQNETCAEHDDPKKAAPSASANRSSKPN